MATKIIEHTENYIHLVTDDVPEWVKKMADCQNKIHQYIKEHGNVDGLELPGVKFVKPL